MQPLVISAAEAPTDITNLRLVRMIGSVPVHIPAIGLGLLGNDIGTAVAGDVIYGSAAGTWARLAKGTALQHLRMNSGATAPEWASYATIESLEGLSLAAGDILYATGADTLAKLAKGTALQVLRQNSALTAPEWATAREVLTANRTYYVRTDGSDSNTGLVNSAGGAFLTIQKAIDVAVALDLSVYSVTIQAGNGTYTGANSLRSFLGSGPITIVGDETTPANVVISTTSNSCFAANGVLGQWRLRGMKLQTTTSGNCIVAQNLSLVSFQNIDFGACAGSHILSYAQGFVETTGNYTISGGATRHWWTETGGIISAAARTITISGTPAFSSAFAFCFMSSTIQCNANTFSGSATGTRYSVTANGVIFTNGAGATYLPGNAAGSAATGGQYV